MTILEEGMAEVFAYIYMQGTWKGELPSKTPGSAYHEGRFLCRAICYELAGETISLKAIQQARRQRKRGLQAEIASTAKSSSTISVPWKPKPPMM